MIFQAKVQCYFSDLSAYDINKGKSQKIGKEDTLCWIYLKKAYGKPDHKKGANNCGSRKAAQYGRREPPCQKEKDLCGENFCRTVS